MEKTNEIELTQEQTEKIMDCDTPEELMAALKSAGYEISEKDAKEILERLEEMSPEELKAVAGGGIIDFFKKMCKVAEAVVAPMVKADPATGAVRQAGNGVITVPSPEVPTPVS